MSRTTTLLERGRSQLSCVPEHGTDIGAAASTDWTRTPGTVLGGGRRVDRNSNLSRTGAAIIARRNVFREEPWKAPSVQALTRQMGRSANARPLLVEGPAGPVISAVGQQRDHSIASDVLGRAQESRVRAGIAMPRGVNSPANQQQRGQRRKRRQRPAQSFGAVFEHRDAFGKPKFIGRTDSTPEARFAQDIQQHQTIRNMMTYQQGRSDVVWSGVGQYPLGPEEMSRITEKIVEERSKKLHAQKLRGPKPYSRHGY